MKHLCLFSLLISSLLSPSLSAQDEKANDNENPKVVKLSGRLEPVGASELSANTDQFTTLEITKILPHGAKVKKGQAVVWFETKGIDKQIAEAEVGLRKSELAMQNLEIESKQLAESTQMDRESAQRAHKKAVQDYDNYVRTLKGESVENAESSLKSFQYSLDNAMEELTQLQQMYEEDELTEESEEIVLKRASRAVESAKLRLKHAKTANVRTLQQVIPAEAVSRDVALRREQLAFDKKMRSLDTARRQREIEIEEEKRKHRKLGEDLAKLRADRKRMVITAAQDGILYHGAFSRGKISEKPSVLKAGAVATSKQILGTIVRERSLQVRIDLPEKELRRVKVGSKGTVAAVGYPAAKISGVIKSVSSIPFVAGKFDCVMSVRLGKAQTPVVAGMNCTVEIEIQ